MQAQTLLESVRVVDLSQYIPGPLATRQLADLGAEVIKIEPPDGDPMRRFMHHDGDGLSPIYRHLNRGKRIGSLDLKDDAQRAILRELLAGADILLESFRPGVLARLGFDQQALAAINPRLIHCALSGYGQEGPYAQRAGHDINYCALTGQSSVSGIPDRPVIGFPPIADHASALQAGIAMLAALHARNETASGVYIDLSIAESILAWQYLPLLGDGTERAASILDGGAACYNIYRCADGRFVSLGAIEAVFWKNFCSAVQRPRWIDRQFEAMPQKELIGEVAALVAGHPLEHWRTLLEPVDCCFEALLAGDEIARQPQFRSRRALGQNGPAYPAWIDRQPVRQAAEPELLEAAQGLQWNSVPADRSRPR
jgi:crotonobetainyl-CoA:carnitine CoA-transferase CaiB-like acyl-CoA transferase